jgi:hypothetical protein
MKIGAFTYNTEYTIRIDELAHAAEEHGLESVWAHEHTHIPKPGLEARPPQGISR